MRQDLPVINAALARQDAGIAVKADATRFVVADPTQLTALRHLHEPDRGAVAHAQIPCRPHGRPGSYGTTPMRPSLVARCKSAAEYAPLFGTSNEHSISCANSSGVISDLKPAMVSADSVSVFHQCNR